MMTNVFIWQRADGWAWKVDDGKDENPHKVGLLLREWAIDDVRQHFATFTPVFTSPDGIPSRNA